MKLHDSTLQSSCNDASWQIDEMYYVAFIRPEDGAASASDTICRKHTLLNSEAADSTPGSPSHGTRRIILGIAALAGGVTHTVGSNSPYP